MKKQFSYLILFVLISSLVSPKPLYAGKKINKEDLNQLLGTAYTSSKDYNKAAQFYEKKLEKNPKDIKALFGLGDMLLAQEKLTRAAEPFEKILLIKPQHFKAKVKLAQIYVWQKNTPSAKKLFQEILNKNPQHRLALIELGKISAHEKNYDQADLLFEKALTIKKDRLSLLEIGKAYFYSGNIEKGKKIFRSLVDQNPNDSKAQILLADALRNNREFKEAIEIYEVILEEKKDVIVMEKLAITHSWARNYDTSVKLYKEVLEQTDDKKTRRQFARVLGWDKQYKEGLKQYEILLDQEEDPLIELEYKAKKYYWKNWPKKAIKNFEELIEKDPNNLEARFDLSQIYNHQSLWKQGQEECEEILEISPIHFRSKIALNKLDLILNHPLFQTGYRFFDAESEDRMADIHRHSFFNTLSFIFKSILQLSLGYTYTKRSFRDFSDVQENEGRIQLLYWGNLNARVQAYYDLITYDQGINSIHTFGYSLNSRLLDVGSIYFFMDRERLENSSTVIKEGFYRDLYHPRVQFDLTPRLKLGGDYHYANYSDKNEMDQFTIDLIYLLSIDPERLSLTYRGYHQNFKKSEDEYFSPRDFWFNSLKINWRYFFNKEEIFYGSTDFYYDLAYEVAIDSQDIVNHKFSAEIYLDINNKLNFNIKGHILQTSADVYEETGLETGFKIYF